MLLLFAALVTALLSVCRADEHEYRLYEDLMRFYNPLERPVENNSFPVKVTIGLVLQQIVDMDEKNQMIQINAWVKYTWHDYKLRWEPGEYGGVGDLRFPSGKIWHPDVLVYNSADSAFDSTYHCNHVVY
uniref:Neurotransmitter-gated ion-channel ligand-binding domain-containing protein n=1 Tax=Plectus sambesii TaxID=2011161 RepID=A0A914X3S8_9BILA